MSDVDEGTLGTFQTVAVGADPNPCNTCGHATPHRRLSLILDNSGFRQADACEEPDCNCINDPAFKLPQSPWSNDDPLCGCNIQLSVRKATNHECPTARTEDEEP